jgi:endonuclease III
MFTRSAAKKLLAKNSQPKTATPGQPDMTNGASTEKVLDAGVKEVPALPPSAASLDNSVLPLRDSVTSPGNDACRGSPTENNTHREHVPEDDGSGNHALGGSAPGETTPQSNVTGNGNATSPEDDATRQHDPATQVQAAAGSTATVRTKRKREPKQTVPIKGGWALPHGMGIQLTSKLDDGAQQEADSSSLVPPTTPSQNTAPVNKTPPPAPKKPVKKAARQTTQSRIIGHVTKPGAQNAGQPAEARSSVPNRNSSQDGSEDDDGNQPLKRRKTIVKTEETETREVLVSNDGPAADNKSAQLKVTNESAKIKIKKEDSKNDIENKPKLLVIRGVKIVDNVVAKLEASNKITVDASQILNPDYRIKIKRGKDNPYGLTPGHSPYPYRRVPTPEQCEEVHRLLTEMHGEVPRPETIPPASLEIAGCGEVPCVLDALLRTLISGNTLMDRADAAVKNLIQHYGIRKDGTGAGSINWDKIRLSSHQELTNVIRIAGNGPMRSKNIKKILDMVYEENMAEYNAAATAAASEGKTLPPPTGIPNLDHIRSMSKDEAIAKMVSYPGIGIKTAACVALFCLRMPCFAVDTHVHKFCRWLGWVPANADPDNCFRHGEVMVPDQLKYNLHQLFIRHGKTCFKCRKVTKPGTKDWNEAPDCPLEHLLDRSKDEAKSSKPSKRKQVNETEQEDSKMDGAENSDGEERDASEKEDEERDSSKEEVSDADEDDGVSEVDEEEDDDDDSDWAE